MGDDFDIFGGSGSDYVDTSNDTADYIPHGGYTQGHDYEPSNEVFQDQAGQMWIVGNDGRYILLGGAGDIIPSQGTQEPTADAWAALMNQQTAEPPQQQAPQGGLGQVSNESVSKAISNYNPNRPYNEVPKYEGTAAPTGGEKSETTTNKDSTAAARPLSAMKQDLFDKDGNFNWMKGLGLLGTGVAGLSSFMQAKQGNREQKKAYADNQGILSRMQADDAASRARFNNVQSPYKQMTIAGKSSGRLA